MYEKKKALLEIEELDRVRIGSRRLDFISNKPNDLGKVSHFLQVAIAHA